MKTHRYLVFVLALVLDGCVGNQSKVQLLAEGGPKSKVADITPQSTPLPPVQKSSQTVIGPAPATNEIVFHFVYPCALTNGFIQSSTDLVHWETRTDFIVDDANTWTLRPDPTKPMEFFRAGGEVIGSK
jgi:hypothetical protein